MYWEITALGIIAILFFLFVYVENKDVKYATIEIDNRTLKAEVADTLFKKTRGLMFRDSPPEAMLFVSSYESKQGIWMKNVRFPIDIIWIKDDKVIDIAQNVQPCKNLTCTIYYPKEPSRYIVEVPANWTKDNKINIGSKVKIPNNI